MKCFLKSIVSFVAIFCMMGMAYNAQACCSGGTPPANPYGDRLYVTTGYSDYYNSLPRLWTCSTYNPATEANNIWYQITVSVFNAGNNVYTMTHRKSKYDGSNGFSLERPTVTGQINITISVNWECQRMCGNTGLCPQGTSDYNYWYAARSIWRGYGSGFSSVNQSGSIYINAPTNIMDAYCCF